MSVSLLHNSIASRAISASRSNLCLCEEQEAGEERAAAAKTARSGRWRRAGEEREEEGDEAAAAVAFHSVAVPLLRRVGSTSTQAASPQIPRPRILRHGRLR
ncbi:unnamed protein product [Urochloa humidicola]